jgi:TolB-like protein/Tfp pilus assembly protein PilF/class 3 adenylate cyclase
MFQEAVQRLHQLDDGEVGAVVDELVVGVGGISPAPGVGERVKLRLANLPARLAKEDVVISVRIKRRIEIDQIDARVGKFFPVRKPFQVVTKIQTIHERGKIAPIGGKSQLDDCNQLVISAGRCSRLALHSTVTARAYYEVAQRGMHSKMATDVKQQIALEIAHVLFIDIVAYSKMAMDDQHAAIEKLNQIVQATNEYRKGEAENRLLKLATGDGMALIFYRNPQDPVECALEISRAIKDQHSNLSVRMGVNSGPVSGVMDVNVRANVAGAGINMAQRVMDCGDAGHILLSKRVAEDLEQFKQWRPLLHDLGTCEVKHGVRIGVVNLYSDEMGNPQLPRKFQLLKKRRARARWAALAAAVLLVAAIIAAFVIVYRKVTISPSIVSEKSIAVLPFENLSEDKANAFFADGIQDEILTRLSKIADLKVISRTSTQRYKTRPENLPEIARQLGVANILEGSVQKSGDAVRVNVQLIKAATDSHVWADTYERKLTDIFSVETEVAKAIADQLRAKLTGQEEQVIAARSTDNPEAYDAYLRGLAYTLKTSNTPDNSLGAQKYLREAVRLDPKFALAWALLAYVDASGYLTLTLQPTAALREEARQAAETALSLQPNLGEALVAKGFYYYGCLKEYETAARYFEQARQFLPNSSWIPESLAYVARRQGQWDRSETYFNEAERLDPRNVNLLGQHALSYICLRRFPKALRHLDQVLNITPDDVDTLVAKVNVAQRQGDLSRAAAFLAPRLGDDPAILETQIYQAILERRAARILPRLKEILAKPDPALGNINSELRFWLGWAQKVAGDHVAAQETWRPARSELEASLKEEPENCILLSNLALINMGLGDKAGALALAERAVAVMPVEKDAVYGPFPIEILARVAAQTGQRDRAIAALQKVLSTPYAGALGLGAPLTPALLRLDPMFDPLRNDPRFKRLAASDKPKL